MGACSDKSTTFLKKLGYNVVRNPRKDLGPLGLIGRQKKTSTYLGTLDQLITNAPGPLPTVQADIPAAEINGQVTSKLSLGIGINILGAVIGAMGGNLGVNLGYTNAQKVQFGYSDVFNDLVLPLDVGNYLRDGEVDADNLILKEYVLGKGRLFLITKIAKSNKLSVSYERNDGTEASVDVPVVQQLAGGNVKVTTATGTQSNITYEGPHQLTFGFVVFEVGVEDGVLRLTSSKPGAVPLAVGFGGDGEAAVEDTVQLSDDGLLDLT